MADKAGLWEHMTARYGLQPIRWQKLTAWPFVDACMSYDMVQSTTKIRLAGFNGCIDTHQAIVAGLKKLQQHNILP